MYWLWGALGAFVFAVNAFIFAVWSGTPTRGSQLRAFAEFVAALLTGAICAQGFTETLQPYASHWIKVDTVAVALTIGWVSNYLWPRLLRKLGERVDAL